MPMRPLSRHVMLGAGGVLRVPESESIQLERAIELIEQGKATRAVTLLRTLQDQAASGYHRNVSFQAGKVIGKIGTDVHDIRYTHATEGKNYKHDFGGDVEVYAVERNGKRDLLLHHVNGLPLWDEF